jgi:hypothetical protein
VCTELANALVASAAKFLVDIGACLAQETSAALALKHGVLHFYTLSVPDAVAIGFHMFAQLASPDI